MVAESPPESQKLIERQESKERTAAYMTHSGLNQLCIRLVIENSRTKPESILVCEFLPAVAGHVMLQSQFVQFRFFLAADIDGMGTTSLEFTAGWRIGW